MEKWQIAVEGLYSQYLKNGIITEDDIFNTAEKINLPLLKLDKLCNELASKGVYTLEQVGRYFGVTRERIRQIETKAVGAFDGSSSVWQCGQCRNDFQVCLQCGQYSFGDADRRNIL